MSGPSLPLLRLAGLGRLPGASLGLLLLVAGVPLGLAFGIGFPSRRTRHPCSRKRGELMAGGRSIVRTASHRAWSAAARSIQRWQPFLYWFSLWNWQLCPPRRGVPHIRAPATPRSAGSPRPAGPASASRPHPALQPSCGLRLGLAAGDDKGQLPRLLRDRRPSAAAHRPRSPRVAPAGLAPVTCRAGSPRGPWWRR